jgi:hypothetical protein
MRLSPLLGFGPKLKRVNTNNSARSMGESGMLLWQCWTATMVAVLMTESHQGAACSNGLQQTAGSSYSPVCLRVQMGTR